VGRSCLFAQKLRACWGAPKPRQQRRRMPALVVAVLAGAGIGAAVALSAAVPKSEAAGANCGINYNVVGAMNYGGEHRGERVHGSLGMKTYSPSIDCAHLSTIDIYQDASDQLEVGYQSSTSNTALYCASSDNHGQSSYYFYAKEVNGAQVCKGSTDSPSRLSWHTYTVEDGNADDVWQWWRDDISQWGPTTINGFQFGYLLYNGERHGTTGDSAQASFRGLQFESSNGWSDFPAGTNIPWCDTVSDYELHINSPTSADVVSGSGDSGCQMNPH
jgi:hypothetical protein